MDDNLQTYINAYPSGTKTRVKADGTRVSNGSPTTTTDGSSNALIQILTERLSQQGKGIASSSSSNLQASINEAIASTTEAGKLGSQALQSEREREVGFAMDRAGATYTGALEGRTGYATQVSALRELTETTEKSVRDLDKRYQEAILANDAATAQRIADLKIKKLEFQQQQEQNFFQNLMSAAQLRQTEIGQQMQSEQFYADQESRRNEFILQMAQSGYQFEKNTAIQYKQLDLQEQQLDIEKARLSLSQAEYRDRKAQLAAEKSMTFTKAMIQNQFRKMVESGTDLNDIDPLTLAPAIREMTGFEGDAEILNSAIWEAYTTIKASDLPPIVQSPARQGGLLGQGGLLSPISGALGTARNIATESILGTLPGQASTASSIDWAEFARQINNRTNPFGMMFGR